MTLHPLQRFLGVDPECDLFTLLGISESERAPTQIDTALHAQIERTYRHPDGRSVEADQVRAALREAARMLKRPTDRQQPVAGRPVDKKPLPTPQHPSNIQPEPIRRQNDRPRLQENLMQLSAFDRHVLAVLVSCGGWNKDSRARLVSIAMSAGVSVQGLLRVLEGLSDYARRGGARLSVAEITSGAARFVPASEIALRSEAQKDNAAAEIAARYTPELTDDSVWSTIKLSALFGLAALFMVILTVRLMRKPHIQTSQTQDAAVSTSTIEKTGVASNSKGSFRNISVAKEVRPAHFDQPPTFLGQSPAPAVVSAADQCLKTPPAIHQLARRVELTDEPAEAVFRDWRFQIDRVATGWLLLDRSTRDEIDEAIFEVFHAAGDHPSVCDRLMSALDPLEETSDDSITMVRNTWKAGMLATCSRSASLPETVRRIARNMLATTMGEPLPEPVPDFDFIAEQWLDQQITALVDVTEFKPDIYDQWELWITSLNKVSTPQSFNSSVMNAIHAVLVTGTDLARPGTSVDVLGRLLSLADFHDNSAVRNHFSLIFDDEQVSSADLWVMTSILVQYVSVSWFRNDLLVPPDANTILRRRIRDLILRRWPRLLNDDLPTAAIEGSGMPVDPELGRQWITLIELGSAPVANDPEQLITQLIVTTGLNQVAARLASRQNAIAESILNDVEAMLSDDEVEDASSQKPSPHLMPIQVTRRLSRQQTKSRIGQAIGPDGQWAAAYEQAGRNTQEKINWLRSLRLNAGTDLGPIDAAVLVREAFRAPRLELRSIAQSVLVDSFAMGPNITMELLDQFPDAPRVEDISDLIQRLTGRVLPGARDDHWKLESRLALLDHALSLTVTDQQNLDLGATILTESYLDRLAALRRERNVSTTATTPDRAVELLIEAWRLRAAVVVVANPIPADLTSLDRRRTTRVSLAQGPIQRYVAQQLALLDLLIYITVAEQPQMGEPALIVLRDAFSERSRARSSLQQALITERALLAIWRLRLSIPNHTEHEPLS